LQDAKPVFSRFGKNGANAPHAGVTLPHFPQGAFQRFRFDARQKARLTVTGRHFYAPGRDASRLAGSWA
jgi:hypothetical protein